MEFEDCYVGMDIVFPDNPDRFFRITKLHSDRKEIDVQEYCTGKVFSELSPGIFHPLIKLDFDFDLSFDDLMGGADVDI